MLKLDCFKDRLYVYLEAGRVKKTKNKIIEFILPEIDELNENGFTLKQICESINNNDCYFKIELAPLKTTIARIRRKKRQINQDPLQSKSSSSQHNDIHIVNTSVKNQCSDDWEQILGFKISERCLTRLIKSELTTDFISNKEFPNEKRLSDFLIKYEITNKP
ncbi:hypothetical protein [Shewanella septentrionalis]|uniref:Uncharacterized protein n=1 Tax=Shewanella septentrionalis TaxID=2952223 RepID=A0A9X2WYD3_9GAMM|nr:hypothetical protein [Shewanella septentrionalis]MCT7947706.1 hypothetical protein [Shewanella septentrionalis]